MPVPTLVDAAVFEAAQAQLAENRQRKRDGLRGPRWLLQGLTVCHRCGYAFYGKTVPRSSKDRTKGDYRLYRCIGTDGYRYGGTPMCSNHSVRADHLEQAVWDRVCALLEQPDRLAEEYRRRLQEAGDNRARMSELSHLEQQISALQRGIGRLIDSYAAGVIERGEFEPRISGLKARVAGLQEQQRAAAEAAQAERELTLVIGQVEDFAARVRHSLDGLEWLNTREIIRTLVRQVEIDTEHVEVVFRVPLTATKPQIKEAIEALFKVNVTSVNTMVTKGKSKFFRGNPGKRSDVKKAIVTLKDGQSIDVATGL